MGEQFDNQEAIDPLRHERRIQTTTALIYEAATGYNAMLGRMADIEKKLRGVCMDKMKEGDVYKRMSMEKLEMASVADDPPLRKEYLELVGYRKREDGLRKILAAHESTVSGCQSLLNSLKRL